MIGDADDIRLPENSVDIKGICWLDPFEVAGSTGEGTVNFKRLMIAGVVFILGLLGLLLVVSRGTEPARSPAAPTMEIPLARPPAANLPGPKQAAEDHLAPIEEEIARRLEAGKSVKNDAQLFERLYAAALGYPVGYPARLWFLFFDQALIAKVREPELQPSPRDREAFNYLTKVVDPAWSLRVASVSRGLQGPHRERMRRRENIPTALLKPYDAAVRIKLPYPIEPWFGVTTLILGDFQERRGRMLAEPVLRMARKFLGDLKGKVLADVGSGCGPMYWFSGNMTRS